MAKEFEQLLEKVRKYLRRLHEECKLPPDLENGRLQLLCKIDDFYRDHFDKLGKEDGYLTTGKKKKQEQNGDTQSLSSQLTQSTVVSEVDTSNMLIEGIQPVPATALTSAIKCGFLCKKRKQEKIQKVFGPQKRWCVIKDGIFFYYDKDRALKQKGAFYVAGYEASACGDPETCNTFSVTCPGKRSFTFSADTNESMSQWISTINLLSGLQRKASEASGDKDGPGKINCDDSPKPPVAPPRGRSANKVLEDPNETSESIDSYEDTDVIPVAGIKAQNKHQSILSTGTVYEDTEHMEDDGVTAPSNQNRLESASTEGEVYEDTDAPAPVPGYSNNFGSKRNRILSDSSEGSVYEDTEEGPCVKGAVTARNRDDETKNQNNNNKPSYINAKREIRPIKNSFKRGTIHPPPKESTNGTLYENIDRTNLFYALYDCKSVQPGELEFFRGDIIFILHRDNDDWWTGQLEGKIGLVPHNYLSQVYQTATTK